jgi:hypothetical protein
MTPVSVQFSIWCYHNIPIAMLEEEGVQVLQQDDAAPPSGSFVRTAPYETFPGYRMGREAVLCHRFLDFFLRNT